MTHLLNDAAYIFDKSNLTYCNNGQVIRTYMIVAATLTRRSSLLIMMNQLIGTIVPIEENPRSEGEIALFTVQRCDGSKALPIENQYNKDATFPQGRVGLENIKTKNAHHAR